MYKIIAVNIAGPNLDVSLNNDTKQSLSELILDKIEFGIETYQMQTILSSIIKTINIEQDITDPLKKSLLPIHGMRSMPQMETATSAWVDTYVQQQMGIDMRDSLLIVGSDWGSKALLLVADKLGIKDPEEPYVRVKISFGKVIWWINDGKNAWWKPGKVDRQGIQPLSIVNQTEIDRVSDTFDLSLENFMKFKRAGKRSAAYKKIHLDDTYVLERNQINISNLAVLRKWDVSQYGVLPKSNKFDKDHVPQDKWLSEAWYEFGPKIDVAKKIQLIIQSGNNAAKIRKAIKELAGVSNLCNAEFPVLRDDSFTQVCVAASENFKKKDARQDYETQLSVFRNVLGRNRITYHSLANKVLALNTSMENAKNNAYSIAVPKEIHKFSRTFALDGRITEVRRTSSFTTEMLYDISHYTNSEHTKRYFEGNDGSLEGIGALRYLYRKNVKAYGIHHDLSTDVLDKSFIDIFKRWEDCNLT